jgi:hypothetical protein
MVRMVLEKELISDKINLDMIQIKINLYSIHRFLISIIVKYLKGKW